MFIPTPNHPPRRRRNGCTRERRAAGRPALAGLLPLLLLAACQSNPQYPELATVSNVDLDRYVGDWYVIATIPTRFERDAFDAVERYERRPGYIDTTFIYRKGGHDGPEKRMRAKGYIRPDSGNARWGMQFIWPIRADFRVIYLDEDYQTTIVGRQARDYVWIMARTPRMAPEELDRHRDWLASLGYDIDKLVVIAHR
jgi:apolipoprotein D and lipocalin family protein